MSNLRDDCIAWCVMYMCGRSENDALRRGNTTDRVIEWMTKRNEICFLISFDYTNATIFTYLVIFTMDFICSKRLEPTHCLRCCRQLYGYLDTEIGRWPQLCTTPKALPQIYHNKDRVENIIATFIKQLECITETTVSHVIGRSAAFSFIGHQTVYEKRSNASEAHD